MSKKKFGIAVIGLIVAGAAAVITSPYVRGNTPIPENLLSESDKAIILQGQKHLTSLLGIRVERKATWKNPETGRSITLAGKGHPSYEPNQPSCLNFEITVSEKSGDTYKSPSTYCQ